MYILTVQPITRGVLKDTLSYFSKDPTTIGTVIFVPVRSQEVPALVVEIQEVFDAKSSIKSSGFSLRKIQQIKPLTIWDRTFIEAVQKTAHIHAQGFGDTLLLLTPKTILDAYVAKELAIPDATFPPPSLHPRLLAIQNSTTIRLESYQRLVRESFVRNESTFICAPTEQEVERIAESLRHGIEDYVFVFHSGLSKKRTLERWRSALKERHAILVIGTPQYLALERYFTTIILDEEHARGWKSLVRPLIDMRVFIESYAHLVGSTLILGAPILRTETQKRIKEGTIEEFERIAVHTQKNIKTALIDPRIEEKAIKERTGKRTVQILTSEVRTLIEEARVKNESVVLISARKGLAPITVCDDCGTVVRCTTCDNPLVIHHVKGREKSTSPSTDKKAGSRIFTCHACGFVRVPEDDEHETCTSCGGWRLGALGIGTERIQEEVEELFPDTPHVIFDGEHITTRAQAKKCIARFEEHPHSILIGTPMAIPYLATANHIVIISLDSLFAIPDFRINEHIFAMVLTLREKATKSITIQTRADDTTLYTQALAGDLLTFSENELALRKAFFYPPYTTIVKIILRGNKEEFSQKVATLKMFLAPFEMITPNTVSKEAKNVYRTHVILKLKTWPDEKLIPKLRALPPEFTVDVNPDHLL